MPNVIRFIESELINFTSHRSQQVTYGDITRLSGKNGEGKSSIGTAPAWVLYSTDLFGKMFNPSPTNYEYDRVFASLLLSVDGVQYKFAREIEKGKNAFYVNDVPIKAKDFEAAVEALFDKDSFMALYHPAYFFGLHWSKQREQIMRYVLSPDKQTVLVEMSRTDTDQKTKDISLNPSAVKLAELTKKHSIEDLQKIHGGTGGLKSKLEKQHIAAQSRTKTLREQFDRLPKEKIDIAATEEQEAELLKQIKLAEKVTDSAGETNRKINALQSQIDSLTARIEQGRGDHKALSDREIKTACDTCGQELTDESKENALQSKGNALKDIAGRVNPLIQQRKQLREELVIIEPIDVSEQLQKIRELEQQRQPLLEQIRVHSEQERLQAEVERAKSDEEATLASLRESTFILDAIKSYRSKEAELQAEKVQSLFTTLSIRLFKYVKTKDEYEPDFSIQMDGKDYAQLSKGEKIAAELELTEVLYKQSEMIAPIFIDNIESYTGKVAVFGQLITARAVPGQELKIETEGTNP